ncbi:MAG: hypothetical protein NW703_03340 [Nitrospiraceae bacterium]
MSESPDAENPRERSGQQAVDFAIHSANLLMGWLPGRETSLRGKTVLEVGPGQDFGMPLILMGFGARTILVDRYLCDWDSTFHPTYYRQLREAVVGRFPGIDTSPLDQVIKAGSHVADGMTLLRTGLECIHEVPQGSVDVSYSNAVFEHLEGVHAAVHQLARITRQGGSGFHQVDFRDHRDFNRPLEYLTIARSELEVFCKNNLWWYGNAMRYGEFQTCFEVAGFNTRFEPNLFADEDYVRDIQLRADRQYRDMPLDAFRVLGGRFYLERTKQAYSTNGSDGRERYLWNCLVDLDTRLIAAHDRISKLESCSESDGAEGKLTRARQQLAARGRQLRRHERWGAHHVVRLAKAVRQWLRKVRNLFGK